jgi:hypothetical protein
MNVNDPKQIGKCSEKHCYPPFHQPGSAAGFRKFNPKRYKTCPNMMIRLKGDNPNFAMTTFESRCPADTSKIALVVDPYEDYHFLRQDSNMYWSHKAGAQPVKNTDANGHKIWNPELCDLDYSRKGDGVLNYKVFCSFMCIPRKKGIFIMPGGGFNDAFSPARPFRTDQTRGRS